MRTAAARPVGELVVEHLCRGHRPTGEREVLAQLPLGLRLGHPAFQLYGVEPRFASGAAQGLFLVEQLARVAHPQAPEQRTHSVGFVAASRDDGEQAGIVAAIRGRSEVSMGIPWSWAIRRNARACSLGQPRSS